MPGFKEVFLRFLAECEELSYEFIDFIAEALGLEKDSALRIFFDPVMQHRAKVPARFQTGCAIGRILTNLQVVKYPPVCEVNSDQGVGPHFDSGFLTFVCLRSLVLFASEADVGLSRTGSCCRRHRTMGFKSKTFLANGLTCHPFLEHS